MIYVPMLAISFIMKRWNTKAEIIYLIETNILKHQLLNVSNRPDYNLTIYTSFEQSKPIINKRIEEEQFLDERYSLEVKKRFNSGDTLYVLELKSQPITFLFTSTQSANINQINLKIPLVKGCFTVYDVYTFKNYRSKGYYQYLLSCVIYEHKKLGFTKFWLWLMKHNQISVKVHDLLGINHVIKVFTGYYRYGIKHVKQTTTDFFLDKIIDK